ncbi:MAG: hypothetical protein KKC30_00060 [Proteobacteria bacterium]|nr:hypothetical protein [Pseudomonadota bacterium]MBU4383129.1 hypothetical protein [Pseudomonadota bacterium]MBU4603927.1 hypothetical protein [Pseudomonadota bacterium]MCG2762768.1 hypothetical protein [Desulfarculaceae bacterium]
MSQPDTFGADPSVRAMRRVFAAIEAAQAELLARLGVSALEPERRAWREGALRRFQAAWPRAAAQGLAAGPEQAARLYLLALGRAMTQAGRPVPPGELPVDPALDRVLGEAGS